MIWLTAVAGIQQHAAQGINLLFFLPTALAALLLHVKNRFVRWKVVIPAALAGSLVAAVSAWIAAGLKAQFLRTIFGVFLLFVGAKELFFTKKKQEEPMKEKNPVQKIVQTPPSFTDPNGSYTGKPENVNEVPVQDADDL